MGQLCPRGSKRCVLKFDMTNLTVIESPPGTQDHASDEEEQEEIIKIQVDEETGAVFIPDPTGWNRRKNLQMVQAIITKAYRESRTTSATFRSSSCQHIPTGLSCGSHTVRVPWTKIAKDNSRFISPKYLPEGCPITIAPAKMHNDDYRQFLNHWHSRQVDGNIPIAFHNSIPVGKRSRAKRNAKDSSEVPSEDGSDHSKDEEKDQPNSSNSGEQSHVGSDSEEDYGQELAAVSSSNEDGGDLSPVTRPRPQDGVTHPTKPTAVQAKSQAAQGTTQAQSSSSSDSDSDSDSSGGDTSDGDLNEALAEAITLAKVMRKKNKSAGTVPLSTHQTQPDSSRAVAIKTQKPVGKDKEKTSNTLTSVDKKGMAPNENGGSSMEQ